MKQLLLKIMQHLIVVLFPLWRPYQWTINYHKKLTPPKMEIAQVNYQLMKKVEEE